MLKDVAERSLTAGDGVIDASKEPVLAMIPDPKEPKLPSVSEAVAPSVALPVQPASSSDQFTPLARIEDKTARIEEKFARAEERMVRVESALEKATLRLEGATQDMNLQGLKDDMIGLRDDIRRKPGLIGILMVAVLSAVIGAALAVFVLRFGIPGLLPALAAAA